MKASAGVPGRIGKHGRCHLPFTACVKRSVAVILLATAFPLLVSTCKKLPVGHPPAVPSKPMGISHGGYNSTYEFSATTTDPDTDSVAIHFSWGDGATSEWSTWVASGETIAAFHSWSSPGTYQVKAQAKDKPGNTSDWSSAHSVAIIATQAPTTPGAPTGPSTARKDSLCTFTTIATDPDGDGVSYRFDWGTGDTSAWTDWVPSGQPAAVQYAFHRSGTFSVRAQARDVNEALSSWSNSLQVSVANPSPPSRPSTPSGLSFGDLDSEYAFSSGAGEPDGDSVNIRFSWGDGDTSAWSQLVRPHEAVVMKHAWRDTGVFAITAQARDEYGTMSVWSYEWSFITRNRPPDSLRTPQGPSECLRESVYAFTSSAIDPDDDSVCLRFSWGDGDTSTWSGLVQTGQPVTSSHVWLDTGSFVVTSQAMDEHGETCGWSEPCSVLVPLTKWRFATGFQIASSPAIGQDGTVYTGSRDGCAYAVNPNGALKWRYQTGDQVFSSPAIAADGTVYIGSGDRYLYAINADGSLRWRYHTGGSVRSPAIASDGTVCFGSLDSWIYAINPDSTLKWRYRTGGYVISTSIADDGAVYAGSDDHYLYAINPDGTLRWRYLTGYGIYSSPGIAADGTVYFGSDDRYLHALNADGTLKWRYLTGGTVESSPAISEVGTIYVGSTDSCLYALNSDGTLKWRYVTTGVRVCCPTVAADGSVYVLSEAGLYALLPDGTLKWRSPVGSSSYAFLGPAIAPDGTVYVGAGECLYAVPGESPLAASPWPKFHHDNRNTGRVGGR
jgi:outer membrane protein assembly factor BamB